MTLNSRPRSEQETDLPGWKTAATIVVQIIYALVAIVIVIVTIKFFSVVYEFVATIDMSKVLQHGPAAIGIPVAGVVALFIVCLARALDGRMYLDLFGLRAQGASATCIVWGILFLIIGLSFRALW